MRIHLQPNFTQGQLKTNEPLFIETRQTSEGKRTYNLLAFQEVKPGDELGEFLDLETGEQSNPFFRETFHGVVHSVKELPKGNYREGAHVYEIVLD